MGRRKPDLIICLGLFIIVLVVLAFLWLTNDQAGFFQNFAPIF